MIMFPKKSNEYLIKFMRLHLLSTIIARTTLFTHITAIFSGFNMSISPPVSQSLGSIRKMLEMEEMGGFALQALALGAWEA